MLILGMLSSSYAKAEEDPLIKHNTYIFSYIPSDSTIVRGDTRNNDARKYGAYKCNKSGMELSRNSKPEAPGQAIEAYPCSTLHSATGSSWVVRYAIAPHGPMFVEEIFQLKQKRLSVWATFNNKRENIYATSEARKYASAHGGDTNVAKGKEENTSNDPIKEATKVDPDELVKKGIGILKGMKF